MNVHTVIECTKARRRKSSQDQSIKRQLPVRKVYEECTELTTLILDDSDGETAEAELTKSAEEPKYYCQKCKCPLPNEIEFLDHHTAHCTQPVVRIHKLPLSHCGGSVVKSEQANPIRLTLIKTTNNTFKAVAASCVGPLRVSQAANGPPPVPVIQHEIKPEVVESPRPQPVAPENHESLIQKILGTVKQKLLTDRGDYSPERHEAKLKTNPTSPPAPPPPPPAPLLVPPQPHFRIVPKISIIRQQERSGHHPYGYQLVRPHKPKSVNIGLPPAVRQLQFTLPKTTTTSNGVAIKIAKPPLAHLHLQKSPQKKKERVVVVRTGTNYQTTPTPPAFQRKSPAPTAPFEMRIRPVPLETLQYPRT